MADEIKFKFRKEDIGSELLPILTTGLYRDPLDTLREYIQNGIDANANHIKIKIDPDQVVILDNGTGMDEEQTRKAIRLGISDKDPIQHVGFRGIGIYSSFNLCDKVTLFTKQENKATYCITFDFKKMRAEIAIERERKLRERIRAEKDDLERELEPQLWLEKLLNDTVHVKLSTEYELEHPGTKVIFSGLLSDVYDRLNNWHDVTTYLGNVVPLPFKKNFKFSAEIEDEFKKYNNDVVRLTLTMPSRREELFRPYDNSLFQFGGKHPVKIVELSFGSQKYGFAWICINDARSVLKNKEMRGLLIKKRGFSIGDRSYLRAYFPRSVFYNRIIGEIILINDKLIPNAARNDFEFNSTRQSFFQYLPRFIQEIDTWANKIQEEDIAKETLTEVTQDLKEINAEFPTARRDKAKLLLFNNELQFMQRRLHSTSRKTLGKIAPDDLSKFEELWKLCSKLITDELTQHKTQQKKLEEKIGDSILAAKAIALSEEEIARIAQKPKDISHLLIDTFDVFNDDEAKGLITFIDEQILKQYLSDDDYQTSIELIKNYLEGKS